MNERKLFIVVLLCALLSVPCRALSAERPRHPVPPEKKTVPKAVKKTVPELIESYRRSTASGTRYFIVRDLGLSKDERAVPFLVSLVETGDFEEKRWAVDAFAAHGSTDAVPVMQRVLEDPGSLAVPGKGAGLSEEELADRYDALRARAVYALMRLGRNELAYPWIEKLVFEKRINVLACLVEPDDRKKGVLARLVFRDQKAKEITLRALDADDTDLSVTAAYYLAENGYRNEKMYRVVDRAWQTVRGDPRGGVVRGRVIGTLKRMNTRKARKKLAEIERYLSAEKRRRGMPAAK